MKIKSSPKIIGCIFTFVAVIIIIMGTLVGVNSKQLQKRCTDTVTAEIVENIKVKSRTKTKNGHKTVITYRPVYSFYYNGQNYRIESNVSHRPALFDVGERTEIKINPSDISETYIPADKSSDYAAIICIAMGIVFLAVGLFVMIKL